MVGLMMSLGDDFFMAMANRLHENEKLMPMRGATILHTLFLSATCVMCGVRAKLWVACVSSCCSACPVPARLNDKRDGE